MLSQSCSLHGPWWQVTLSSIGLPRFNRSASPSSRAIVALQQSGLWIAHIACERVRAERIVQRLTLALLTRNRFGLLLARGLFLMLCHHVLVLLKHVVSVLAQIELLWINIRRDLSLSSLVNSSVLNIVAFRVSYSRVDFTILRRRLLGHKIVHLLNKWVASWIRLRPRVRSVFRDNFIVKAAWQVGGISMIWLIWNYVHCLSIFSSVLRCN